MPPIPPLKLYEAARLMDSFEKPNILAGIQTTADEIKSGQKEAAIPEERQDVNGGEIMDHAGGGEC